MIACSSVLGPFWELFNRLCSLLATSHFCIPTGCELSFQMYILNSARNVLFLCHNKSDGKQPVFLVLKVTIATLLEILCEGAHISAKLLPCPVSGISSRLSSKLWSSQLDSRQMWPFWCCAPFQKQRSAIILVQAGQTHGAWERMRSWPVWNGLLFLV